MTELTNERYGSTEAAEAERPQRAPRKPQPRKRNPRRVVLEKLRAAKANLDHMVHRWQFVPGTFLYRNEEGRLGYWGARARKDIPDSEYIENDPKFWAELHNHMAQLEADIRAIRLFAAEQYTEKGGKTR